MVPIGAVDQSNFEPLASANWQVHVYGRATTAILYPVARRDEIRRRTSQRSVARAARGCVALAAGADRSAAAIAAYLTERSIVPAKTDGNLNFDVESNFDQ